MQHDPSELLERLGAASGDGVRVLLLDSGARFEHPEFAKLARYAAWRFGDEDRVIPDPAPGDELGHGTAVASIVHRHAPGAELHVLRIFDAARGGLRSRTRSALLGLGWGIEQGYDLINCSFVTEESTMLAAFKALVDQAFRRNVLLVASSDEEDPAAPVYPADFPSVLATTHGPLEGLSLRRRPGRLVEFQAPGQMVRVAWGDGGYRIASGSSYAAAHLAALAARLRQLHPEWNACQVKAALYSLAGAGAAGAR